MRVLCWRIDTCKYCQCEAAGAGYCAIPTWCWLDPDCAADVVQFVWPAGGDAKSITDCQLYTSGNTESQRYSTQARNFGHSGDERSSNLFNWTGCFASISTWDGLHTISRKWRSGQDACLQRGYSQGSKHAQPSATSRFFKVGAANRWSLSTRTAVVLPR